MSGVLDAFLGFATFIGLLSIGMLLTLLAIGLVFDARNAIATRWRRRRFSREARHAAQLRLREQRAKREELELARERMWAEVLAFPGFAGSDVDEDGR